MKPDKNFTFSSLWKKKKNQGLQKTSISKTSSDLQSVCQFLSSSYLLLLLKAEVRVVFQPASMQVASISAVLNTLQIVDTFFYMSNVRNPDVLPKIRSFH